MKKIALFLAEGFEEIEAVTPMDLLRRAGIDLITAGVTGPMITGGHGITIRADRELKELTGSADSFDGVIVPGGVGGAENIAASVPAVEFIKNMMNAGKLVAAICAAPALVLTPLGIIDGKQATCYPGFEEKFTGAKFAAQRVVADGNVITSRGPGTAAEFSIAIIAYLEGEEKAEQIRSRTLQKV